MNHKSEKPYYFSSYLIKTGNESHSRLKHRLEFVWKCFGAA
jgi:hypothetical protein